MPAVMPGQLLLGNLELPAVMPGQLLLENLVLELPAVKLALASLVSNQCHLMPSDTPSADVPIHPIACATDNALPLLSDTVSYTHLTLPTTPYV